ncbi:MAG: NAD(P)/FAD-dependent oxidoreductase, partial [Acidimicrobiales bacterium]
MTTGTRTFDLVAIGGGAGGLAAARAAAIEGRSAALITDGPIGGDCTWTGCIPSKTLIAAAGQGDDFGVALKRVRDAVAQIAATENAEVLAAEGIAVIEGRGVLRGSGTIDVGGVMVAAKNIILATGGSPAIPPIPGLAKLRYLTNENIWDLEFRPERLGVLGGGPIGCELAQAFARLGVQVSLFEMEPRLLPRGDPEASAVVQAALESDGVHVLVGESVSEVRTVGHEGAATLAAGAHIIDVDKVLVATGRRPSTSGMGLDEAGIELTDRGFVKVDRTLRTSVKTIWAVGDVNGLSAFTHAADEQGRLAAWTALGRRMRWTFDAG